MYINSVAKLSSGYFSVRRLGNFFEIVKRSHQLANGQISAGELKKLLREKH